MIDRERALAVIRRSPLAAWERSLVELLEPSIRIGVRPVGSGELALGASRFGGQPDLPAGFAWPRFGQRPLGFIAQIAMREVASADVQSLLPADGWLCFFFDAVNDAPFEDRHAGERSWRVAYFDIPVDQLERTEPPAPREKHNEFAPCALGFDSELTLPSFGSTWLADIALEESHRKQYEDLVFALHARPPLPNQPGSGLWQRFTGRLQHWWIGDPVHRMLGHPEHFQIDPRLDWERMAAHAPVVTSPDEATRAAARRWILLLQLDAFQNGPAWLWGDNGTLYFGIRQEDLAARNFENVGWTVECG